MDEVDGSVGGEVLKDHDILYELVVLAAPDLHHRLGIHGDDNLVLFRALHADQRRLVAFQPRHRVLQVCVPH